MNAVIDPTMLILSEKEWDSDRTRDLFLSHLLDNLKIVSENNITKFYWSSSLESSLWNSPNFPPWRQDRDWSNKLVPIIYKYFSNLIICIDDNLISSVTVNSDPVLNLPTKKEMLENFFSLMHFILIKDVSVFFCLGLANTGVESLEFSCKCHEKRVMPELINSPEKWYSYVNICDFWPKKTDDDPNAKLSKAVDLTIKQSFPLNKNSPKKFCFTKNFLCNLFSEICVENQKKILFAISKRILFSQYEATSDQGLCDEPVLGKDGERRFRVCGSSRIHYGYVNEKIQFESYFSPSEHDKGL